MDNRLKLAKVQPQLWLKPSLSSRRSWKRGYPVVFLLCMFTSTESPHSPHKSTSRSAMELGCKRAPAPCKNPLARFRHTCLGKGHGIADGSPGRRQGRDK